MSIETDRPLAPAPPVLLGDAPRAPDASAANDVRANARPVRQRALTPSAVRRISMRPAVGARRGVLPAARVVSIVAGPLARVLCAADLGEAAAHVLLEPDVDRAASLASRELGAAGFVAAYDARDLELLQALVGKLRRGPSRLPGRALGPAQLPRQQRFLLGIDSAVAIPQRHITEAVLQFAADAHAQTSAWLRACDTFAMSHGLSPREAEVAFRMAMGHSGNESLARSMGVAKATVISMRKRMEVKLGVSWTEDLDQLITGGNDARPTPFESGAFEAFLPEP